MTGEGLIERYGIAFAAGDMVAALQLFDFDGRYELPLLGQRLVGAAELRAGHDLIRSLTASRAIEIRERRTGPVVIIAEGTLRARLHRDPAPVAIPMALVARVRGDRLARLSFYLDARPFRLWADGPILAAEP
jgi:ketosteroid isomerase-like protein